MAKFLPKQMVRVSAIGLLLLVQFWVVQHVSVHHMSDHAHDHHGVHTHHDHDHHHDDDKQDPHSSDHHQLSSLHFEKKQVEAAPPFVMICVETEIASPIEVQRDWLTPGETLAARIEPRPPSQPRGPPLS